MPEEERERVSASTPAMDQEAIAELRRLFPGCVTEGKVDFEKLRLLLGDEVDDDPERYSFTWTGKRDAIRLLQTPSCATLTPCREESVNFDTTEHLFIEGDNLEVLKLLYKSYAGRVKMIYIDPPYNTGNDFVYPDNYADPLDTYLRLTGQKGEDGDLLTSNPETSGRYHSAWLSMMYPRLFLARQLLTDDGLIFVSIDDVEVAGLRVLMNEVFGEENFVAPLIWKKVYGGGSKVKHVVGLHEYILCYARNLSAIDFIGLPPDPAARKYYTGKDSKFSIRGPFRTQPLATTSMDDRPNLRFRIEYEGHDIWPEKQWQWSQERVSAALANDELLISRDRGKWSVRYKQYLRDENGKERGAKPFSIMEGPYTQAGTAEVSELFGNGKVFTFPKPTALITHLLCYCHEDKEAIVLDFFAGSAPTAQSVLTTNAELRGRRQFIMVQLPEPTPEKSVARDSGFENIADIGKERIRRVIKKMRTEREETLSLDGEGEDLGFRVFKLTESHFDQWAGVEDDEPETYAEQMSLFADTLRPGVDPESVVFEIALKEGYGLNCRVEQREDICENAVYRVTDPDREQSFAICLDEALSPETLTALHLSRDDLFICRDKALDDSAAANLALQCRLKTI